MGQVISIIKGSIFKPVFFEFINDKNLLEEVNIYEIFLIGDSILAAPILE